MTNAQITQYDPPRVYARASRAGDFIFLAGTCGDIDEDPISGDLAEQTHRLFQNMRDTLALFDAELSDVVRTVVYMVSNDDRKVFLAIRKQYITTPVPSTTIIVKDLYPGFLVEVDAIAYAPSARP